MYVCIIHYGSWEFNLLPKSVNIGMCQIRDIYRTHVTLNTKYKKM